MCYNILIMAKIIETPITTILRQTSIDLAPYVINPYQGCVLGCSFCYAQFSKKALKEDMPWGDYVKVKINALEVLEEELERIKPEKVLLGSTTEIFQPAEKQYHITEGIIKLLNAKDISYVLMSRSPLITGYMPLLKQGKCESVYFTLNAFPEELCRLIGEKAPGPETGIAAVRELVKNGIDVRAYLCPIMPGYENWKDIMEELNGICAVECESINFRMAANAELWKKVREETPLKAAFYERLLSSRQFYEEVMKELEEDIQGMAEKLGIIVKAHLHEFEKYFENEY